MQIKQLSAKQIITLNDYPVYNEHVLKIFFLIFQKKCSKIIPPCPVMKKNVVLPQLNNKLKNIFLQFSATNPQAQYFLLDGSHRTTAAALTKTKISAMIFQTNKDIQSAKQMLKMGKLLGLTVDNTIKENITELNSHFIKKKYFQTVAEKTNKMVQEKIIPKYMIDYFNNGK